MVYVHHNGSHVTDGMLSSMKFPLLMEAFFCRCRYIYIDGLSSLRVFLLIRSTFFLYFVSVFSSFLFTNFSFHLPILPKTKFSIMSYFTPVFKVHFNIFVTYLTSRKQPRIIKYLMEYSYFPPGLYSLDF